MPWSDAGEVGMALPTNNEKMISQVCPNFPSNWLRLEIYFIEKKGI